ncbi:MAG TPA: DUF2784 domain-containing protein [Thermodesulfovibrionales bacterium]|nr:DUF2784 domain-containing protein [Thermodesulfovibrionales bacterium]
MPYGIFANGVVFIHFLWILFLIFGTCWGVKNRAVRIFHISGLVFAVVIQLFDWYCPLTHLEAWLRSKQSLTTAHPSSFIIYYVQKIVYVELSRSMVIVLTFFLCGFSAWLYLQKRKKPNNPL